MNDALSLMLKRYNCQSINEYENALKEIIQEIALLGLWRTKFFEKAAFYGGTANRILYGLNRFSEDLDFSLLKKDRKFNLASYCAGIKIELSSLGFKVEVQKKDKKKDSQIQSAFIKTGTLENLILIESPANILKTIQKNRAIKIKLEVDIDPPGKFETEAKYLLEPIPFSVNVFKPPYLFAGKMHAVLCRGWKMRVKGRDWYDFVWYIAREIPVSISHLEERMKQSGHLDKKTKLTPQKLIELLKEKIEQTDFKEAKKDVMPVIKDSASLDVWSKNFFKDMSSRLKIHTG